MTKIRRWLCRHFQLTFREDHDNLHHRWIQHSEKTRVDMSRMERTLTTFNEHLDRALRDLASERESNRRLMLQWLILDVGPAESMDHALDTLRALWGNGGAWDPEGLLAKAIKELEHGLELYRKNKKPEVIKNADNR